MPLLGGTANEVGMHKLLIKAALAASVLGGAIVIATSLVKLTF